MTLADYYFDDPRLALVPIEHLTPQGMSREIAALLAARRGWSAARVALFDAAFALYWERSAALARRTSTWPPPRLRHVAVVADPLSVRPYVQLLNTSAWMLYESDLDPVLSHPELAAYLLVHGDRMALSGEVTTAALHSAAYWFERSDEERAAFAVAAARSPRPDAAALQALAGATGWLRELRHEQLKPFIVLVPHRPIPGTGLLVPRDLEAEPTKLVAAWTEAARRAVETFHVAWRTPDAAAVAAVCDWLEDSVPPLLVTAQRGRIVWDPEKPRQLGALRSELRQADGAAARAIAEDLRVVDRHTRAFHAALVDPGSLPPPAPDTDQGGYSYLHRERRLIAYNLREPGMERLRGPTLPYARAMLGARTAHEWAHLAAMAGWVPLVVPAERFATLESAFAVAMDAVVAAVPAVVRLAAGPSLAVLAGEQSPGAALARVLLKRMPDYQANLVARRFLDPNEQETYVRHNVRTLRAEYPPAHLWRMLVRYLYEYQYLALSALEDRRSYFLRSTWFDQDFFATGVLDEERFDALTAAVAALCGCYAVDESRFRAV